MFKLITPQNILREVNKRVIGHDNAKKTICSTLYLHWFRWITEHERYRLFPKYDLLLLGESGSGKTFLVKEAVAALNYLITQYFSIHSDEPLYKNPFPLLEIDCSLLSPPGYKGTSPESLIQNFYKGLSRTYKEYSVASAVMASTIIYFDEFDKLCLSDHSSNHGIYNAAVQSSLLKIVEGYNILENPTDYSSLPSTNTLGCMCIFSGNFPNVRKARAIKNLGFTPSMVIPSDNLFQELQNSGVITQLCGRLSTIVELKPLTKDQLKSILIHNVLPDIEDLLREMNVSPLDLRSKDINDLVEHCIDNKTGARGLAAAMYRKLENIVFDII